MVAKGHDTTGSFGMALESELQMEKEEEKKDKKDERSCIKDSKDELKRTICCPCDENDDLLEFPTADDAITDTEDDVFMRELQATYEFSTRTFSSKKFKVKTSTDISKETVGSRIGSSVSSILSHQKSSRALLEASSRLTQNGAEGHLYRLLSAKRNHIHELSNDVVVLQNRAKELEEQNRHLIRLIKRQEAALKRYHDMKSELPHIIEAHKMEIKVLHEKLRKAVETNKRAEDKSKNLEMRVYKLAGDNAKLKDLTRKRNLPERDLLHKKMAALENSLQEREKENEDLLKKLRLVEKSQRQQTDAEVARHKTTSKKLLALQADHEKLQETLKTREKELASLQHIRGRLNSSAFRSSSSSNTNLSTSSTNISTITTGFSSRSASLSSRKVGHRKSSRVNIRRISKDETVSSIEGGIVEDPFDILKRVDSSSGSQLPQLAATELQHRQYSSVAESTPVIAFSYGPRRRYSSSHAQNTLTTGPNQDSEAPNPVSDSFHRGRCSSGLFSYSSDEETSTPRIESSSCRKGVENDSKGTTSPEMNSGAVPTRPPTRGEFSLIESYPPRERRRLESDRKCSDSSDSVGDGPSPPLTTPLDIRDDCVPQNGTPSRGHCRKLTSGSFDILDIDSIKHEKTEGAMTA